MNVAKPGGPSGPAPTPSDGPGSLGGPSPAAPERRFADVLAGRGGLQQPQEGRAVANPFNVPIIDDLGGPAKAAGANRVQGLDKAKQVHQPFKTLEVTGERVDRLFSNDVGGAKGTNGGMNWQKTVDEMMQSETRIDSLINAAQRGKAFSASELMGLQIEVFRYSQTVEVISRTTDKLVGGIKQTLGTQV